jgi:hypothetical protein
MRFFARVKRGAPAVLAQVTEAPPQPAQPPACVRLLPRKRRGPADEEDGGDGGDWAAAMAVDGESIRQQAPIAPQRAVALPAAGVVVGGKPWAAATAEQRIAKLLGK